MKFKNIFNSRIQKIKCLLGIWITESQSPRIPTHWWQGRATFLTVLYGFAYLHLPLQRIKHVTRQNSIPILWQSGRLRSNKKKLSKPDSMYRAQVTETTITSSQNPNTATCRLYACYVVNNSPLV